MNDLNKYEKLKSVVKESLEHLGLEAHPFHVSWYNDLVGPRFQLNYPKFTVGFVIISGPSTFEKCVLPYLQDQMVENPNVQIRDPLDESMKAAFETLEKNLKISGFDPDAIHDFDLHPSRKPKVLVQTAAHVAGAVEYFHQSRISPQVKVGRFNKDSKLFGVAIHPKYSGWYAIRGVVILKDLVLDEQSQIERPSRLNLISDEETVVRLLEEFAYNWKDSNWRDIIPSEGGRKYSQDFVDYLNTDPGKRWDFIKSKGFI